MDLRRNTLYSTAGVVLRLGVAVAAGPLLIRGLGLEPYGRWVVLVSLLGLAIVAQPGLDTALTHFLSGAQARGDRDEMGRVAGTALALFTGLGLAVALAFSLGLPWIARLAFPASAAEGDLLWGLRLLGAAILPRFWQQWALAAEAGLLRYDWQAQIESAGALLLNAGLVALAWLGQGLAALAGWMLIATALTLLAHAACLARLRLRLAWQAGLAVGLVRFGLTQWLAHLGGVLFTQVDRLLVNALLGPAAVGLYAVTTSVTARINELSSVPIQAIAPAISAVRAAGRADRAAHIFRRAVRLNALIVYLISAALLLWAGPLAALLVPAEHTGAVRGLLYILVPLYAAYSLNAPGYYAAQGLRWPGLNAAGSLAGGLATLALIGWLAPAWGLAGAAWANAGYSLVMIVNAGAARATGLGVSRWISESVPFGVSLFAIAALSGLNAISGSPPILTVTFSALALLPAAWIDGQSLAEFTRLSLGWVRRWLPVH